MSEPTGPNGWEPILYACFSRLLRGDQKRALDDFAKHMNDHDPRAQLLRDASAGRAKVSSE